MHLNWVYKMKLEIPLVFIDVSFYADFLINMPLVKRI